MGANAPAALVMPLPVVFTNNYSNFYHVYLNFDHLKKLSSFTRVACPDEAFTHLRQF